MEGEELGKLWMVESPSLRVGEGQQVAVGPQ